MLSDTRYSAEAWFLQNVPKSSPIASFTDLKNAPRLDILGYTDVNVLSVRDWSPENVTGEYVLISITDEERDSGYYSEFLGDNGFFREVAAFRASPLLFPDVHLEYVSPGITVLRKL